MDKVFYSWQSDLENATNRNLIGAALERATKAIRNDGTVEVEPVVDRDTANVPGSPDIASTIFEKIRSARAFVCDVSTINGVKNRKRRPTPNPNVLVELGYAIGTLGWEKIVLVVNTAFGRIEDLPFDLRQRRAIGYESQIDDTDRAGPRNQLATILEHRLREVLAIPATSVQQMALVESAIQSVELNGRDAGALVRSYAADLCTRIDAVRPHEDGVQPPTERLLEALLSTTSIVAEFSRLTNVLSVHGAGDETLILMTALGPMISACNFQPRKPQRNYQESFDFHCFLCHELFVCLVAALLEHERFAILERCFNETVHVDGENGPQNLTFHHFDQTPRLLVQLSEQQNKLSIQADLLKSRHEQSPLAEHCSFRSFVAADYFIFLRSELSPNQSPFDAFDVFWRPWSSVYIEQAVPTFLVKARRKVYAERLLPALGLPNTETLRARFAERGTKFSELWRRGLSNFRSIAAQAPASE